MSHSGIADCDCNDGLGGSSEGLHLSIWELQHSKVKLAVGEE